MKVSRICEFIYMIVGIPWLFMMIITSRGFTGIKMALLAILIITAVAEIIIVKIKLNKRVLIYLVIFISYYALSLLWGIYNGFPYDFFGDFGLTQYYLITPIAVLILYTVMSNKQIRLDMLWNSIKYITLIMVIMNVCKVFAFKGIIPDIDVFGLLLMVSGHSSTSMALRVSNEAGLMFLLPLFIVMFFLGKGSKKDTIIYSLILIFGLVYTFVSGRKMLELIVVATILMMICYNLIMSKNIKRIFVIAGLGILAVFVLNSFSEKIGVDDIFTLIYKTLMHGFSGESQGMSKRVENMGALFGMWFESPLIGHGLNAHAASIASTTSLWSYEVVYFALLMQTGVIGAAILGIGVCCILYRLYIAYKRSKNVICFAVMIGFTMFILGGATNPLVYFLWPWMISMSFGEIGVKKQVIG